jgi:hypothetical protein
MTAPIDARCKLQLAGASLRSRRSVAFITVISAPPEGSEIHLWQIEGRRLSWFPFDAQRCS